MDKSTEHLTAINEAGDLLSKEKINFKWAKLKAIQKSEVAGVSTLEIHLDDHLSCYRYHQPIFSHLLERRFIDTSWISTGICLMCLRDW